MKRHLLYLLMAAVLMTACQSVKELKVLQFNIWNEATPVENGFQGIVDNILAVNPDLVTFSEVRNYNDVCFIKYLCEELEKRGAKYYGNESVSTGIISKYQIQSQEVVFPIKNDHGSVIKANINIDGKKIALYSAHLDYTEYSCYLPRGYNGSTWEEMEQPVTDIDSILKQGRASQRDEEVQTIINDAKKERDNGCLVIIGGDFNEPSHLDWQVDTKNMRDHCGTVVNWDCSLMLQEAGYKDAFREVYPNPVTHPGFTYPANNPHVEVSKLAWAPKADDRDRIDFIYYSPDESISLKGATIVGPEGSVVYGKRTEKDPDSQDSFIAPVGTWPTDHKALLVTFHLSTK